MSKKNHKDIGGYQPKTNIENTVPPPVKSSAARSDVADVTNMSTTISAIAEKLTAPMPFVKSGYFKTATVTYVARDKTFEQEIQYEGSLLKAVRATMLEGLAVKLDDGTTYVFAQSEIVGAYFTEQQ